MVKTDEESGSLSRAMRMGKLGLGIAGSYLGYQIQNLYLDPASSEKKKDGMKKRNSARIKEELQAMRGPIMKLGQALSMQEHTLPPELIKELTSLQMQAPPMHPTLMRIQFRKALGKDPEEIFKEFDSEPFAAASLGQVHRAVTRKGETVAVKIQYPNIREVIENDFKILRTVSVPAKMAGFMPQEAILEFERGIMEETDYTNEARNAEVFRKGLKSLQYARVPSIFPKLSTDTVLTMSLLDGMHLNAFLATKPSQAIRNKVGTRLIELFLVQLHGVRSLHADPHPGNYLFSKNGDISVLDFGCVKHLSSDVIELLKMFPKRAWEESPAAFKRMITHTWGEEAVKSKPGKARIVMNKVITFFDTIYPPHHTKSDTIDFGNPNTLDTLTDLWNNAFRHKLINPEFLFASRAEMGVYNILHSLKAKVPTNHVMNEVQKKYHQ